MSEMSQIGFKIVPVSYFVVVPRDKLHKVVVQCYPGLSIEDA